MAMGLLWLVAIEVIGVIGAIEIIVAIEAIGTIDRKRIAGIAILFRYCFLMLRLLSMMDRWLRRRS